MRAWKSRLKTRANSKSIGVKKANYRLPNDFKIGYYSADNRALEDYVTFEKGWNDAIKKIKFVVTT